MKHRLLILVVLCLFVVCATVAWRYSGRPAVDRDALLAEARQKVNQKDLAGAEEILQPLLAREDASPELLLFAADINRYEGDFRPVIEYCERIDETQSAYYQRAVLYRAEANMRLGHFSPAIELYRQALAADPENTGARGQLVFVMNIAGLARAAVPHELQLVRAGQFSPEQLLTLCDLKRPQVNQELLETAIASFPDDPLVLLAWGQADQRQGKTEAARKHLQSAVEKNPNLIEARISLAELLREQQKDTEFLRLLKSAPPDSKTHPDYWVLWGDWCREAGEQAAAIRCYWEAARNAPDHLDAHYQLGQLLVQVNRAAEAEPVMAWSEALSHLIALTQAVNKESPQADSSWALSEQLVKLGRIDEAWAWALIARQLEPNSARAERLLSELETKLAGSASGRFPDSPAARLDFSAYPLPDPGLGSKSPSQTAGERLSALTTTFQFDDVSQQAGLQFVYQNGADPGTEGRRIYEYTGGGVGVLDYDLDGWPDLYFPQGSERSPAEGLASCSDQLCRNLQGTKFLDVSREAGIEERHFGQGVSVGDFDNDGFPDIYVANFGRNQLWRNQGDGTFANVTAEAGIGLDQWTTSCAVADLNGDGNPELFDVNYLQGDNLFTRTCYAGGKPRVCAPTVFAPAQDVVWENLGDGRFAPATESSGLSSVRGNGLGLLIAEFNDDWKPDVFIANDAVANQFWINRSDSRMQFEEAALVSGLAVDGSGRAEACMGIAAGDADGDGRLDLFVTNFYQESNTLYLQQGSLLFEDRTREFGLEKPGYQLLGFGTQFLDADRDGWDDLVVLNGDIDDFSHVGRKERMPPLLLINRQGKGFQEVDSRRAGAFFQQELLGRALAKLDWNRDGRMDFVATFLESPAQLVENRTDRDYHWLQLRLIGTSGSRDAVGAIVTVEAGGRRWIAHVTAGDGYECSNERQLTFGLGDASQIEAITIRWPGRAASRFTEVASDRAYDVVEGSGRLFPVQE